MSNHTPEQIRAAADILAQLPNFDNESYAVNQLREWAESERADDELAQAMRYGSGALRLDAWAETAEDIRQYWRNAARAARAHIANESEDVTPVDPLYEALARAARAHIANDAPEQDDDGGTEYGQAVVDGLKARAATEPPTGTKLRDRDSDIWTVKEDGRLDLDDDIGNQTMKYVTQQYGPLHQVWDTWTDVPEGVAVLGADEKEGADPWRGAPDQHLYTAVAPFTAVNPYGETK